MKQQATFTGWDFVNVWNIDEGATYPSFVSMQYFVPDNLSSTWYHYTMGNTEIYLSDIGGNAGTIYAIAKRSGETQWKQHTLIGSVWTDTNNYYAYAPGQGGGVAAASLDTKGIAVQSVSVLGLPTITDIQQAIDNKKNELLNMFYNKIGIDPSELTNEEIEMLYTGVLYGIDDNVCFGAAQWILGVSPSENDYFFMRAKTFTDAVFTAAYTVGAVGSAAEAARALDTAGLSGAMALATAPTGGGGVAFGSAAVAELAEAAVMAGVSFVSARMADRSQGIFRADMQKLEIIPRYRVFRGISARNVVEKTAEEVNTWWREVKGYEIPPYKPSTEVFEFELAENKTFVRVWKEGTDSNQIGQWFMKAEDIKGLTPTQIADKYGLEHIPGRITDVNITAGTRIRGGIANEVSAWGRIGGNTQYDLMGQLTGDFVNPRNLDEWLLES